MSDTLSPVLQSLYGILRKEKAEGFRDTAVIGGLDGFLERHGSELMPAVGEPGSYSGLTLPQREEWANQVIARLRRVAGVTGEGKERRAPTRRPRATATTPTLPSKPHADLSLDDPVSQLSRITARTVSRLKRLGVETVGDLLYLFPRKHSDFANTRKVSQLEYGEEQTVVVTVLESSEVRQGPRRSSTQAVLGDETGSVRAFWFNQGYLARTLRPGTEVVISGKLNAFRGSFVFESPEYELLRGQEQLVHTGRLVPVYPSVDGLPQRTLRRTVKQALDSTLSRVVDFLPQETLHRTGVMGLRNAIAQAHYPDTSADWNAARHRLAFDEMLQIQIAVLGRKKAWQEEETGISLRAHSEALAVFLAALPFKLTAAQDRVLGEILADLARSKPMSRLLQGDVGSGKTVVAAAALLSAVFSGYQGVLMAPTELLAEQHFFTITRLFDNPPRLTTVSPLTPAASLVTVIGESFPRPITLGLLIGSLARKAKEETHRLIAAGEIDLVIGTHALIQDQVELPRLAVAVVDEQHRFGVVQRASLRGKGRRPHLLAMSATPIPRSLALTVYGDLDVSAIDEMPPGRRRIRTKWVDPERRSQAYNFVRKRVEEGEQAFIVCPLIEGSEVIKARAATEEHARLSRDVFPGLRLGLLHGKLALREKEQVMEQFVARKLDILVSTPVVEVGIDVPNATVMLVDGADRFGLAQLHQFRGRVGRGQRQSYCLLLSDSPGQEARERLKLVERIHDGFELAEEDLRLRGPGDYLGTRQSGLPELKVARITDREMLALARQEAARILDRDPDLSREENALLAERLSRYSEDMTGERS